MIRRRYCHLCGRSVRQYQVYRRAGDSGPGLVVCNRCEAAQPRCARCAMPMAAAAANDGLCPTCGETAPRCLACGRWVGQKYVSVEGEGPFCQECYETRPHCDVCGVPVGNPAWSLADGRQICNRCHQTAVYRPERAQELFERVVAIIGRDLGLELNVPTEFALVDRNRLVELLGEADEDDHPDPAKTLGVFRRQGRRRGMYVEYGLPQILLIQVIAHEYAHAWQGENCPLLRDPLTKEGFAEWVAYRVLQSLGASKKMAVMEARGDVYGDGLRRILAVERAGGATGVLDYCREAG